MRNKHLAGKEALRVSVFMPALDATALARHAAYIGTQYDLSLVIQHDGVKRSPGGIEEDAICFQLYMHDEVTPGGLLIADSCLVEEFYLDNVTVDGALITLVMNNGHEFEIDLAPILANYIVNISRPAPGVVRLRQGTRTVGEWFEGFNIVDVGNGRYEATDAQGNQVVWNTGVSEVADLGNGIYEATNADGSTVRWASQEIPEGMLYLQDPVIYLRQSTGSATPPIESQDDLTPENAFDSFSAIETFLTTCIVQGTITIDARGSFTFNHTFTAEAYNGTSLLTIRGNPAAPSDLTFNWGQPGGSFRDGVRFRDGVVAAIGNCRFAASAGSNGSNAIMADGGAQVEIFGTIVHVGQTNTRQRLYHAKGGAVIRTRDAVTENVPGTLHQVQLAAGAALWNFFYASALSQIDWRDALITVANNIAIDEAVVHLDQGSRMSITMTNGQEFEPRIDGPGDLNGPAFTLNLSCQLQFIRATVVDFPHENVYPFFRAQAAGFFMDRSSAIIINGSARMGTSGIDYV